MLPDLHTGFLRGRSGDGLVLPFLSEFFRGYYYHYESLLLVEETGAPLPSMDFGLPSSLETDNRQEIRDVFTGAPAAAGGSKNKQQVIQLIPREGGELFLV